MLHGFFALLFWLLCTCWVRHERGVVLNAFILLFLCFSGYLVSGVYNGRTPHWKSPVSWYWPYPFHLIVQYIQSPVDMLTYHLHIYSNRLNALILLGKHLYHSIRNWSGMPLFLPPLIKPAFLLLSCYRIPAWCVFLHYKCIADCVTLFCDFPYVTSCNVYAGVLQLFLQESIVFLHLCQSLCGIIGLLYLA